MNHEFYRFRPVSRLLGEFRELENQSIFFAEPETLNDPMEGFRDIYWSGDFVVWRNLFRHYLRSLEHLCCLLLISREEHSISINDIPIFAGEDDFPTDEYKSRIAEVSHSFLEHPSVNKLIESVANRTTPVRKNELHFYLKLVHFFALEIIYLSYEKAGFITARESKAIGTEKPIIDINESNFFKELEKTLSEVDDNKQSTDAFFSAHSHINSQMELIKQHNGFINLNSRNRNLVLIDFSEAYLSQLEKLVFPEWYTACFMTECENSSVWGHYGDNHSGVCLIFNAESQDGKQYLNLEGKNGCSSSAPSYGNYRMELQKIDYVKGYREIDFFRMLGRLPAPVIHSTWHSHGTQISECADDMNSDIGLWREKYWRDFLDDITTKSKDWEYENEYRLILTSSFNDFSDPKDRAFKYNLTSLKGIIFGIKTRNEDKLKIIKLIEEKCSLDERNDFKFYQAYYSAKDKCIKHSELGLLQFNF